MKDILLNKILNNTISEDECLKLSAIIEEGDVKYLFTKIFDLNEEIDFSKANKGFLGFINKINQKRKNKRYYEKLVDNFKGKKFLAEGDSWFEFPLFINDITDCIHKYTPHAVLSIASGGDWLSNIVFSENIKDIITTVKPDYFMMSGGGNDFISRGHLKKIVKNKDEVGDISLTTHDFQLYHRLLKSNYTTEIGHNIVYGLKSINTNFDMVLNTMRVLYMKYIENILSINKNLKIIVHGYDFVVPSKNKNILINPLRLLMNNGNLLYKPLLEKGYTDDKEMKSVMIALIHKFNELIYSLSIKYENLIYVDFRGLIKEKEWADELHPFSEGFKRLTHYMLKIIKN